MDINNTVDTTSTILSEEEVNNILNPEEVQVEESVLPSEENKVEDKAEEKPAEVPTNIVDEFTKRYQEKGGFDEADYKALEAKGYSRDFVDTYVEGVQAKQIKEFETALAPFGKYDEFKTAVEWAANTWTREQIETFNSAIAQGDAKAQAFIAGALIKEMKMSTSNTNTQSSNAPIHTNTSPKPVSNAGYETKSDMMKDMNDSRYHSDPSYRAKVEAKLIATDTAQWYKTLPRGDY